LLPSYVSGGAYALPLPPSRAGTEREIARRAHTFAEAVPAIG
jgi:hypothetical protein